MKNIVILGSTGTVGKNALEAVRKNSGKWRVMGLACRKNKTLLAGQIEEFSPQFVYIEKKDGRFEQRFKKTRFFCGKDGLEQMAALDSIDLIIYAIPGISTLKAFILSIQKGHKIGLATKEIMVAAGTIVNSLLKKHDAIILPVDSEHNAVFQALLGENPENIRKIWLTASGGPFRGRKILSPTVQEVLAHPVWNMGAKITVDSATMFNKAFEIIEAHYLFSLPADKIDVLIHPEAIIHGLAEMIDGTVKGIFSMPDMKFPITFVMDYPERNPLAWERVDFGKIASFSLTPADRTSQWFSLALEAIKKKGSFPAVFNSANEEAVKQFLKGAIGFKRIAGITEKVLSVHPYKKDVSLEDIFEIDLWAKNKVKELVKETK